jgi:hypothetical protein
LWTPDVWIPNFIFEIGFFSNVWTSRIMKDENSESIILRWLNFKFPAF